MLSNNNSGSNDFEAVKTSINIFTVFVGLVASGFESSCDMVTPEKIRAIDWGSDVIDYFKRQRRHTV